MVSGRDAGHSGPNGRSESACPNSPQPFPGKERRPMKLPLAWLVRLGLAGCCLILAGCGGGDVPDPDSDSHAAAESTPKALGPPANVAPDTPAAPETPAPAQGGNAEVAAAPKGDPAAPPTGGGSETAPAGDSGAAGAATASSDSGAGASAPASDEGAAKSDGAPSSTSEMLAMANGPAAPTETEKPDGLPAAGRWSDGGRCRARGPRNDARRRGWDARNAWYGCG